MMQGHFTIGFKHPSPNFDQSLLSFEDAIFCVLFGSPFFAEFTAKYGHLSLVFQELEMELKTTVDYMKRAFELNQILDNFEEEPKTASFDALIRMFGSQLDRSEGSRDLIGRLHQARKYRNRLAHDFLSPKDLVYHISAGGRQKIIQQLDVRINLVIPLVMIVHRIGRAYASDVGMTDEALDKGADSYNEMLGLLDEKQQVEYVFGGEPDDIEESESGLDPDESP